MLDRLPPSLQQHILLEWLSPSAVCIVARAGSTSVRNAVLTSPVAFRAAEGEVLRAGCVRWFGQETGPPTTVVETTLEPNRDNGKGGKDEVTQRSWFREVRAPPRLQLVLWTTVETKKDRSGTRLVHFANGKLHRDGNLSAIEWVNWIQHPFRWYYYHLEHKLRRDLPANGAGKWYRYGKLHRDGDLPALILPNGTQQWYQHGKLHRDHDLPAIVELNGDRAWYQHGKLHRDGDRPAVEKRKWRAMWYQHGKLHRDGDQPAVEDYYGKKWYQHGKLHRDGDQPAVYVDKDGRREWYKHGVLLRTDWTWHVDPMIVVWDEFSQVGNAITG